MKKAASNFYFETAPLVSGSSLEITANGKNTYAFFYETVSKGATTTEGKFTIHDEVNVNLKNGGIGFYYNGMGGNTDIPTYINRIVDSSGGQLNILSDENSYKISIESAQVDLSDLSNLNTANVTFSENGKIKLYKGWLNVDLDSNLDKNNTTGSKVYRDLEIGLSGITVQNGITVSGTEDSLVGIIQGARYNESWFSLLNEGTIDLQGKSSIGMYNKRGSSQNNGTITVEGLRSIGMFTLSGQNKNDGEIIIKDEGVGIYNTTYLDPSDNPYNYSYSSIVNNGKITSNGGNKSIGIFANNNDPNGQLYMELTGNSDINLGSSIGGIGIYAYKSNVYGYNSGKIAVGENGTGIYAKDSTVYLDDLEMNLKGDKAVGFYLDGTTNFTGTGNVNIDGKGIIVFNVVGTGTFDQNFNISSTADSSYTFQNLKNKTSYYNSTASLGQGGVFISGLNSAVLLDQNSNLSSTNSNLVALALDGSYPGLTTINGIPVSHEATNKGIISFGDTSVGLYTLNGASALNEGIISLGNNSEGLFGDGTGTSVINAGNISLGEQSTGLYLKNGDQITNNGDISSNGSKTVGLFLEGAAASTANNTGTINLFGNATIGIYGGGEVSQTINNSGAIVIGDSYDEANPGVGIYNDNINGIVNNSGNITSGKNSVGIYNNGGSINYLSGDMETGANSVGIYTASGSLNLGSGKLKLAGSDSVAIYAKDGASIDNNLELEIAENGYGVILNSGSDLINRNKTTAGENIVAIYSNGLNTVLNEVNADIKMTGSNSIAFYMENGGNLVNKALITGDNGISNIGIYAKLGKVDNSGDIKLGDSLIIDPEDPTKNFYSVGIYGENLQEMKNTGKIEIGSHGIGLYSMENKNEVLNTGDIISDSEGAVGIYAMKSTINNTGNITLSGDGSIGIAVASGSTVKNSGIITINGDNSIGIYGNLKSNIINESTGEIYVNGNNSTGIELTGASTLENYGKIEVASGTIGSKQTSTGGPGYKIPSIINAGIIKVDEKFDLNGINMIIKPDPESFRKPTIEEVTISDYSLEDVKAGFLLTNSVQVIAPSFDFGTEAVNIDPLFTQGTNARVYKFENVFDPLTPNGGLNSGELTLKSGSLTFDAIPNINSEGKVDIWMEKINYENFTQGAWYNEFSKNIEGNYLDATGNALKLYDKLDLVTDVNDLRNDFSQLAGNVYANMNQREATIIDAFDSSLNLLQDSKNNTKENVKINVITGKGTLTEDTDGVNGYDYETVGVLGLREVERTYKQTFGYSLGYLHTGFEMEDGNDSEEQVDTIQLGLHNKYKSNDWVLRNDLMGRASIHNIDRNIDFSNAGRSEINGTYESYSITSDNNFGKEISLGKNASITPYGGLEATYMMRPTFTEDGVEALEVKGNDAWSVKPKLGVELKASTNESKNGWKLKGALDVAYEYELADINEKEYARVTVIEDNYHELSKPQNDKGKVTTKASIGVEVEDRYGIFLTGDYSLGQHNQDEYRAGVTLKAVF